MLKHTVLIVVTLLAAVGVSAASSEYGTFTIPIVLEQETEIESVTITIGFDEDILHPAAATLTGGILEGRDYSLSSVINTRSEDERKIVIYANDNMVTGSGEVASVTFDILGNGPENSLLSLTSFRCNASDAEGGFLVNNIVCRNVPVILGPDVNNDGRIGLQDEVFALQIASGMRRECWLGDIGIRDAVYALRIASGVYP